MSRKRKEAIGYLRTSSAANIGEDKDSERRQRLAIAGFAKRAGYDIADWYSDPAVSGADPIQTRPGFAELLARIAGNGVRTIIVENALRFARDLMVQEVGFAMLRDLGVTLIAADSPLAFLDDGPTSTMVRQILGAVAQFDKAMTVAKLKGARDRARRDRGKCEGRKSYAESNPEMVKLAKELAGRKLSLRKISAALAGQSYVTANGLPFSASAVATMVGHGMGRYRKV